MEQKQILTTETKQELNFQKLLANLAVGDADHDLGSTDLKFDKGTIKPVFNAGIPIIFDTVNNEDKLLNSVINGGIKGTNVTNRATTSDTPPTPLEIGYSPLKNVFTYSAVHFDISCSTNSKENISPYDGRNFGKDFFEKTGLGGKNNFNAAFIVDFSQNGFLEKFTQGIRDPTNNYTIHYLMTPEVVNDPAGKPNINEKSLFANNGGIQLFSYIQTDPSPSCYTAFNVNEPNPANNFFSNYDFTLSPIKSIYQKGKAEKQITTLNIKYDDNSSKPLTDTIEDSKGENSITTVLGYLKNIVSKLTDSGIGNSKVLTFNFNSKVQQKRGGDWFQALSCLDVKNREFIQILPTRGNIVKLPDMPVYFVTHDRIAVAYALLNGVNVIYLDYYGRVFVLKNTADPALQDGGKSIEEILLEGMEEKWVNTTLYDTVNVANNYLDARNKIITAQKNEFNNVVTTVTRFFNSIDENNIYANYSNVTDKLKDLFKAAVNLMFVNINLIDISKELDFLSNYYSIPIPENPEYALLKLDKLKLVKSEENMNISSEENMNVSNDLTEEQKKTEIRQLSRSLNIIKSIQDKYYTNNVSPNEINSVQQGIETWIGVNVPKLDVFRAANNLFAGSGSGIDINTTETEPVPFWKRLLNFNSNNSTTQIITDSLIFLPFIQTLDYDNKNKILNVLSIVSNILIKINPDDVSRGAKPRNIFYTRLANLIKESNNLLNNSPTSETQREVVVQEPASSFSVDLQKNVDNFFNQTISYSTDSNLVSEDIFEINIFKNSNGKVSSGPQNDNDDTEGNISPVTTPITGGGYNNIISKKSVICDVSIPQITRPLLTSLLLSNFNFEENQRAFERINNTNLHQEIEEERPNKKSRLQTGGENDDKFDVLKDYSLGFHPLLPIYMMMSSFYYTLGPKYEGNSFYYTYFTYFNVFETMTNILVNSYLNKESNLQSKLASYIIGYALKALLFTTHTSKAQNNTILEILGLNQEEYFTFSLKNSSFASLMTGAIFMNPQEETQGIQLLNTSIFKNFMNNVNIKQILSNGTSVDNLPDYDVLKENVYQLLKKIVEKINTDRGTPENNTFLFSESLETQMAVIQEEETTPITGITPEERLQAIESQKKRNLSSLSSSSSSSNSSGLRPDIPLSERTFTFPSSSVSPSSENTNIVYSTTSSTSSKKRSRGGGGGNTKKTKKNGTKNNKKKTIKRNGIKNNKKKTIKRKAKKL